MSPSNRIANIYIILINWNNWEDTIVCLESIFRIDYPDYKVIVCDNNSQDNSLQHIEDWASGLLDVYSSNAFHLRQHIYPPVKKTDKAGKAYTE